MSERIENGIELRIEPKVAVIELPDSRNGDSVLHPGFVEPPGIDIFGRSNIASPRPGNQVYHGNAPLLGEEKGDTPGRTFQLPGRSTPGTPKFGNERADSGKPDFPSVGQRIENNLIYLVLHHFIRRCLRGLELPPCCRTVCCRTTRTVSGSTGERCMPR